MYIGVSAGKFDELIADRRMPPPIKIDSRKVWDIRSLDLAFDALKSENQAPNSWLRYVNEYVDRHGKVRRYFRRPGSRAIALPGLPGSIEFMAAYQAALAIVAPPPPSPKHVIAGSLADVVARYYGSALFANLSSAAQQPIEPRSRKSSRLTVIVCCATCRRMPRSASLRRSARRAPAWQTWRWLRCLTSWPTRSSR